MHTRLLQNMIWLLFQPTCSPAAPLTQSTGEAGVNVTNDYGAGAPGALHTLNPDRVLWIYAAPSILEEDVVSDIKSIGDSYQCRHRTFNGTEPAGEVGVWWELGRGHRLCAPWMPSVGFYLGSSQSGVTAGKGMYKDSGAVDKHGGEWHNLIVFMLFPCDLAPFELHADWFLQTGFPVICSHT